MANEHADDVKKHVRVYIAVFVTLLVLTIVTVAASYIPAGVVIAIAIALLIASVKGFLVASYFMHLIKEKPAIYALLLMTASFAAVMMSLFVWSLNSPLEGTSSAPLQQAVTQTQAPEGH